MILAFDIGGTAIKYGIVTESGEVQTKGSIKNKVMSTEVLIEDLRVIIDNMCSSYGIDGIAMTVPAITNPNTGEVLSEGSMPFLVGTSIKAELAKHYDMPIHSENDGNCAALAEVWLGAGKDYQDIAVVVIGTGVGGAVIKNKKMHPGKQFLSGEFGYIISNYDFDKGDFVIWSESGGVYTLREDMSEILGREVSGKDVFDLAESGNEDAVKLIDRFYNSNAIGLFNIQYTYDPEIIVLGGAVSEREEFIPEIEKRYDRLYKVIHHAPARPTLVKAKYGNDANLIGAVYHFLQKEGKL